MDYTEFFYKGEINQAVEYCKERLKTAPADVKAVTTLARALAALKQVEAALNLLDDFIIYSPNSEKALVTGRYLSFQHGYFERSIGFCEKHLALREDDQKSIVHKIYALVILGHEDAARRYADEISSANLKGATNALSRIDQVRRDTPALYEAWRLCPIRPKGSAFVSAAQQDETPPTLMQYWSQGSVPTELIPVCDQWDAVAQDLGLPVARYDKISAREWINTHAADYLSAFDSAFHPAMEADVFRIAHASVLPTFYVDIDCWPMQSAVPAVLECMAIRGTLLYLRDYMPWVNNCLFLSYPESPFISELCTQALAVETDYTERTAKIIEKTFGPHRYNTVLRKVLDRPEAQAQLDEGSMIPKVTTELGSVYFIRESSIASVKPPFRLEYKFGDDNWKNA